MQLPLISNHNYIEVKEMKGRGKAQTYSLPCCGWLAACGGAGGAGGVVPAGAPSCSHSVCMVLIFPA